MCAGSPLCLSSFLCQVLLVPVPVSVAMTTILESEAYLKQRAEEIGISEGSIKALVEHGVKKLSTLAFAHGQPGQAINQGDFEAFAKGVNKGTAMSTADTAGLKQLLFEAHVLVTQQLKARIEEPSSETAIPKQIPMAERNARMDKLRKDLQGVLLEGSLEPAHSLLDLVCHMVSTKVLRYIGPERCPSRSFEIAHLKPKKTVQIEGTSLSVKDVGDLQNIDPHGVYENLNALKRRGLAFHFADLMSWRVHEKYLASLMDRMSLDPPPGYGRTSLGQVLRADKEAFQKAMKEVTSFSRTAAGDLPLDSFFKDPLSCSEVAFHLLFSHNP